MYLPSPESSPANPPLEPPLKPPNKPERPPAEEGSAAGEGSLLPLSVPAPIPAPPLGDVGGDDELPPMSIPGIGSELEGFELPSDEPVEGSFGVSPLGGLAGTDPVKPPDGDELPLSVPGDGDPTESGLASGLGGALSPSGLGFESEGAGTGAVSLLAGDGGVAGSGSGAAPAGSEPKGGEDEPAPIPEPSADGGEFSVGGLAGSAEGFLEPSGFGVVVPPPSKPAKTV